MVDVQVADGVLLLDADPGWTEAINICSGHEGCEVGVNRSRLALC